ncbi:MAG: hypothetical protein HRT89_07290 [Lentisphaeria bacterium]|nr:hypothetical protein [Lentisphaeria bacterium]NQZ67858.1 hypothetical protein [Lentisphaeria bacterium]
MSGLTRVYQHSGKIGTSPLIIFFLGIPSTMILGFIYGYVSVYNPLTGIVSVLLILLFSVAVGIQISLLGKSGKCRNMPFLYLAGFILGVFAVYYSWVVFLYAFTNRFVDGSEITLLKLILNPGKMWDYMGLIAKEGWFEVSGSKIKGGLLWAAWIGEALFIIIASTISATFMVNEMIFCENCNKWCDEKGSVSIMFPEDQETLDAIAEGNMDVVLELPKIGAHQFPQINCEAFHCPNCTNTVGFSFRTVFQIDDGEGKLTEEKELIGPPIILEADDFEAIMTKTISAATDENAFPADPVEPVDAIEPEQEDGV